MKDFVFIYDLIIESSQAFGPASWRNWYICGDGHKVVSKAYLWKDGTIHNTVGMCNVANPNVTLIDAPGYFFTFEEAQEYLEKFIESHSGVIAEFDVTWKEVEDTFNSPYGKELIKFGIESVEQLFHTLQLIGIYKVPMEQLKEDKEE